MYRICTLCKDKKIHIIYTVIANNLFDFFLPIQRIAVFYKSFSRTSVFRINMTCDFAWYINIKTGLSQQNVRYIGVRINRSRAFVPYIYMKTDVSRSLVRYNVNEISLSQIFEAYKRMKHSV